MGNQSLAFHDFQDLVDKNPQNHTMHQYAGDLLMVTG
jgi:hypothetical protein